MSAFHGAWQKILIVSPIACDTLRIITADESSVKQDKYLPRNCLLTTLVIDKWQSSTDAIVLL